MQTANPLSHVVVFTPTGAVSAMHLDAFPLGFLGSQNIARASDIRHNEATQAWDMWLATEHGGEFVQVEEANGFSSYDEARKVEVEWLQNCRAMGHQPLSEAGKRILALLREH